jgi:hypothetical protein
VSCLWALDELTRGWVVMSHGAYGPQRAYPACVVVVTTVGPGLTCPCNSFALRLCLRWSIRGLHTINTSSLQSVWLGCVSVGIAVGFALCSCLSRRVDNSFFGVWVLREQVSVAVWVCC